MRNFSGGPIKANASAIPDEFSIDGEPMCRPQLAELVLKDCSQVNINRFRHPENREHILNPDELCCAPRGELTLIIQLYCW